MDFSFYMNRDEIKSILADQRQERSNLLARDRIIRREQLDFWKDYPETNLVKVIMGVRRSGKTIFSYLLLHSSTEKVSMIFWRDSMRLTENSIVFFSMRSRT